MKTKVKIISQNQGVSLVRETHGARREDDLFVEVPLGEPGDVVDAPDFLIEDGNSEAAKRFFSVED